MPPSFSGSTAAHVAVAAVSYLHRLLLLRYEMCMVAVADIGEGTASVAVADVDNDGNVDVSLPFAMHASAPPHTNTHSCAQ
jgi:hypothetical protein